MKKQNKEATYTKDQVKKLVSGALAEVVIALKDPSLIIAGMLAMKRLDKKLK